MGSEFSSHSTHTEDRASDDMFDFALFLKYFISRVQDFLDESQWCLILAAIKVQCCLVNAKVTHVAKVCQNVMSID